MIYFNVYSHFFKKFFLIGVDYPVGVKVEEMKSVVHERITEAVQFYFVQHDDLFENITDFHECFDKGFIAVECMFYNTETATCSFTPMTKESFFYEIDIAL